MSWGINWRQRARMPKACQIADSLTDEFVDADRASGLVICSDCGWPYSDHPRHPHATFLTVICDGRIYKL